MNITATIGALLLGLAFAAQAHADTSPTATLDAFYAASAGSNQSAFIAQLTEDAVLLGVDGGERLQGEALRDYVSKSFGSESATATNGNSWGYHSSDRHIRLSADGTVAWFDESLQHEQLGAGRASGVLVANGGNWKIAQYNRTVPLPGVAVASPAGAAAPAAAAAAAVPAAGPKKSGCMQLRHKTNSKGGC
ncbi:MAG: nuclear transport factor 2 family protein [Haliea sp.]|nr:nuclear transport factor 2 family protein [Haliea sp.]